MVQVMPSKKSDAALDRFFINLMSEVNEPLTVGIVKSMQYIDDKNLVLIRDLADFLIILNKNKEG